MSWTEACISVTRDAAEVAEEALEQLGALAITLEDDENYPVLETGPGNTLLWPVIHLRGLFESSVDRACVINGLRAVPGAERPELIRWREIGDQNWERAWMERFKPMRFGRRLWIVPGDMGIPSDPENIVVKLDPGLAFGTGTHPTTALCLEWLDGRDLVSRRVVDYGCGSGILGIAAALLGAVKVDCVDNDPQALETTRLNSERNRIGDRISCALPEAFTTSGADIILANILADPLADLAPVLTGSTRAGGRIVLSGLLEEQGDEVSAAYGESCELVDSLSREGWLRQEYRKL